MSSETHPLARRLLDFSDSHGALLAEFDYYQAQQLLHVRWHGHLTAASVIEGARAGMALRRDDAAPRRLLDDKSLVSGDWSEALPWLQYEWLPPAVAAGLKALAYVLPPDLATQTSTRYFIDAVSELIPASTFHSATDAHQWLLQHG